MPSYRTIPKLLLTSTCLESLIERGYYELDVNFSYRQTADAHDSLATTNATMALIKSLKGKSIAWNLQAYPVEATYWTKNLGTQDFKYGVCHLTHTSTPGTSAQPNFFMKTAYQTAPIKGHTYYVSYDYKTGSSQTNATLYGRYGNNSNLNVVGLSANIPWTTKNSIISVTANSPLSFLLWFYTASSATTSTVVDIYFRRVFIIDLTLLYGSGNEPTTAEQFETDYQNWFGKKLTYEPYSAGEIRNFSMSGIKTTGFNQCVYPAKYYANTSSIPSFSETYYTKVIGGVPYHVSFNISGATSWRTNMRAYDLYGTLITEYSDVRESSTIGWYYSSGSKAFLNGSNNTTTSFDITFALNLYVLFFIMQGDTSSSTTVSNFTLNFKRNGVRDGNYEAYVELTGGPNITLLTGKLNGTGNSVSICPNGMLQAGDVRDEIYVQDGKRWFAKRVGRVDLGTQSWIKEENAIFRTVNNTIKLRTPNLLVIGYTPVPYYSMSTMPDKGISASNSQTYLLLRIKDTTFTDKTAADLKTAMSGVILNYELATPEYYLLDDEWQVDSAWSYNVDDWGTEEVVNSSLGVSTPIEGTIKYYNPLRLYSYGLRQNEIACVHDAQVVKDIYKNGILSLHNNIWDFFPINSALSDNGKERYFRIFSTIEGMASKPSILNIGSAISSVKIIDKSNDGNYIVGIKTNGEVETDATKYAVTLMNDYGVSFKIYLLPSDYWSIGEMTFSNATTLCEYFFIGSSTTLTANSLDPGYIFRAPRLLGYNFSKLATYSNPTYGFPETSTVTFTYPISYPYSISDSCFSPIHIVNYDLSASDLDSVYTPMYSYNSELAKGADGAHPSNFVTGLYIYIVKRTGKLLTVLNNNSSNNGFTIYSALGVPEYSKVTINLSTGGLSNTTLA